MATSITQRNGSLKRDGFYSLHLRFFVCLETARDVLLKRPFNNTYPVYFRYVNCRHSFDISISLSFEALRIEMKKKKEVPGIVK